MFVHRCNCCCVYVKEIVPCSPKYRGIWAICMHKMMFPLESCNSVSKGTFREFRPFSVIAKNHWPYIYSEVKSLSISNTRHRAFLVQQWSLHLKRKTQHIR